MPRDVLNARMVRRLPDKLAVTAGIGTMSTSASVPYLELTELIEDILRNFDITSEDGARTLWSARHVSRSFRSIATSIAYRTVHIDDAPQIKDEHWRPTPGQIQHLYSVGQFHRMLMEDKSIAPFVRHMNATFRVPPDGHLVMNSLQSLRALEAEISSASEFAEILDQLHDIRSISIALLNDIPLFDLGLLTLAIQRTNANSVHWESHLGVLAFAEKLRYACTHPRGFPVTSLVLHLNKVIGDDIPTWANQIAYILRVTSATLEEVCFKCIPREGLEAGSGAVLFLSLLMWTTESTLESPLLETLRRTELAIGHLKAIRFHYRTNVWQGQVAHTIDLFSVIHSILIHLPSKNSLDTLDVDIVISADFLDEKCLSGFDLIRFNLLADLLASQPFAALGVLKLKVAILVDAATSQPATLIGVTAMQHHMKNRIREALGDFISQGIVVASVICEQH
jgi:hypothetical protein